MRDKLFLFFTGSFAIGLGLLVSASAELLRMAGVL